MLRPASFDRFGSSVYRISILSSLILSPNGGLRMGISIQVPFVSVDL